MIVRYSHRAIEDEVELYQYISERFGDLKAREVSKQMDHVIDLIASMPEMYPRSSAIQGLRKCVFSKQTSIYYRIEHEVLEIVSIRSNYSNPEDFKL